LRWCELDPQQIRGALDVAAVDQETLRLVIDDATNSHLLFELLHHPELGFLAMHPWCEVVRRSASIATGPKSKPWPMRILLFISLSPLAAGCAGGQ
jgi:hypothetical protein